MDKKKLRADVLGERQTYIEDDVRDQSREILECFQREITVPDGALVHLFCSIVKFKEVQTQLFFDWLISKGTGLRLVLPRVLVGSSELCHHRYEIGDTLLESRWGVPEPLETVPQIAPSELDLVIVPLLAFDDRGYRLGYGGGFYDRFLAQVSPDCQKVGVAFKESFQSSRLPIDEFDIQLDAVVTPERVYRF